MASKADFSTPDIPMSDAVFHVSACTQINAPASLVFRTLRNTETWRDWNRWMPRVTITLQPDDEDDATLAEIEELVRNTSIAVSFDSEITDGMIMPENAAPRRGSLGLGGATGAESGGASLAPPRIQAPRPISPPAVTRQRLASNASRLSDISKTSMDTPRSNSTNGGLSAAQKFQVAQEARRASVASGKEPPPTNNSIMLESPANPSLLMPAPPNTQATALAKASRRKSGATSSQRRQLHINALYGEPSVRIQVGTKMTLYMKMKLPTSQEMREQNVVVSEVSRPDDSLDEPLGPGNLARTQTHTVSKSGVYRLVWAVANSYNPPKSYPKFLLQAQRVHEIRPIIAGDGKETCEYWDWECQRGMLAKKNKKEAQYMEERMVEWGRRLGEFCESMGGAVERRDFSISA